WPGRVSFGCTPPRSGPASPAPGWPASSLISAAASPSNDDGGGGPNRGSSRSATPGLAGPTAATTWRQNRTGSLSPASSDSQATGRPLRRAQSASATVLPYPAGARTSTSPCANASSRRTARPGARQVQLGGQQDIVPGNGNLGR